MAGCSTLARVGRSTLPAKKNLPLLLLAVKLCVVESPSKSVSVNEPERLLSPLNS